MKHFTSKTEHPPHETITPLSPQSQTRSRDGVLDGTAPAEPQPVVVPVPEATRTPLVRSAAAPHPGVHVAPNSLDLVAVATDPLAMHTAQEQRDLNHLVHHVLVIGLVISATLMVIGIGLGLLYQRELPTVVPDVGAVLTRILALRPSGFLALGLLVLIATPILRVVGSIGAFLYERDWRYAGITGLVLLVLVASILLGRG